MHWDHMSEFIWAAGNQNCWIRVCQFSAFPQQPLARFDFFASKAARGHLFGIKTTGTEFLNLGALLAFSGAVRGGHIEKLHIKSPECAVFVKLTKQYLSSTSDWRIMFATN